MPMRFALGLLCAVATLITARASEPASTSSATSALAMLRSSPNDLSRYRYLEAAIPQLSRIDQLAARQLLASAQDELGLYNEALMTFPFDNRITPPAARYLPTPNDWKAVDAADAITRLAAQRHIVMINEAHHDAHTRELTLALLPRLRTLGFRYFAVEALGGQDTALATRGYPIQDSGTEYLHEPLYGEIVRQAIKLGYIVVPYDTGETSVAEREAGEAENLYRKVFAKDPQARLFVHAGYSHIDKAAGNLGDDIPSMAMQLKRLSGIDPLSVEQTQFRYVDMVSEQNAYGVLVQRFEPRGPIVLINRNTGVPWAADSMRNDISVVLPPARPIDPNRLDNAVKLKIDSFRQQAAAGSSSNAPDPRPHWLTLQGTRREHKIDSSICGGHIPCVVDAHYIHEPDDAIAADRYTFVADDTHSFLYLYPGQYRLRAWGEDGLTTKEEVVKIGPE